MTIKLLRDSFVHGVFTVRHAVVEAEVKFAKLLIAAGAAIEASAENSSILQEGEVVLPRKTAEVAETETAEVSEKKAKNGK